MAQTLKTDRVLFPTIVLMVCFGLVMVYSASSVLAGARQPAAPRQTEVVPQAAVDAPAQPHEQPNPDEPEELGYLMKQDFLMKQAGWALISFMALMFFKRLDYHKLASPVWAFGPLGVVTAMLVAVYFLDPSTHRWLRLGGASLQPSEFVKPTLVIFLAWFLTRRSHAINGRHTLLPAALILGVLTVAMIGADLGTTAVCMTTGAAVLYVAGVERRYFLAAALLCLLVLPAAIFVKPYRLQRVLDYVTKTMILVDPDLKVMKVIDPEGKLVARAKHSVSTSDAGYQPRQSKIAIASGGVKGRGLMNGIQKLFYLPKPHNDFIFAIIGEELGLWGALAVLAGYLVILWRGFRLYFLAHDDFGRYLAIGISVAIVSQALMNISVALDMMPTKGFPLPLISHGGSNLLSSLTSLGILLSVSEHAG